MLAEFDAFIREHGHCETDAECVLVDAQCLRGCGVPVSKQHRAEVLDAIEKLNAEYEATSSCSHWLCLPTTARCERSRCASVVVYEDPKAIDAAVDGGQVQ